MAGFLNIGEGISQTVAGNRGALVAAVARVALFDCKPAGLPTAYCAAGAAIFVAIQVKAKIANKAGKINLGGAFLVKK